MANTFELIASSTASGGSVSSIDFTSIPSTYTDLCVLVSSRDTYSAPALEVFLRFNGITTNNYTYRRLQGSSSSATSQTGTDTKLFIGGHPGATATSNTFSNIQIYIPNYTGSQAKALSVDSSFLENNSGYAFSYFNAGVTGVTAAITSITLLPQTQFAQHTSAYLYGVKNT